MSISVAYFKLLFNTGLNWPAAFVLTSSVHFETDSENWCNVRKFTRVCKVQNGFFWIKWHLGAPKKIWLRHWSGQNTLTHTLLLPRALHFSANTSHHSVVIILVVNYVLCSMLVIANSISDPFLCRSLMWERTWWYQMSSRLRSTWLGCGGDIWLPVEELEPCHEPSPRRSTDSKSSCRCDDAHTFTLPARSKIFLSSRELD